MSEITTAREFDTQMVNTVEGTVLNIQNALGILSRVDFEDKVLSDAIIATEISGNWDEWHALRARRNELVSEWDTKREIAREMLRDAEHNLYTICDEVRRYL